MHHLTIETLARLIDEAPNPSENAHLELCEDCRTELEGLKADAVALSALPEIEPPSAQWAAIETRLRHEGLMQTPLIASRRSWLRPALQLAAALAIFVLGSVTGSMLLGQRGLDLTTSAAPTTRDGGVSNFINTATGLEPQTVLDAQHAVRAAETEYLTALTRYAELASRSEATDPLARLAALESIVLTTRAALGQAPADPVINGYHLTAMAQRDATIKQLAAANGKTWF